MCAQGNLACSQILYRAQSTIVVGYDNELNILFYRMCEYWDVSVETWLLSHSLKDQATALKHDWHANVFVA